MLTIPDAPSSIQKGIPLKEVLNARMVNQLADNLSFVDGTFHKRAFTSEALDDFEHLSITERSQKIAMAMFQFLPKPYSSAIDIILLSLTPPLEKTDNNGLAPMFYMPHCHFIALYGLDKGNNNGKDPFDISMKAQYELTKRFTAEFSIRPFLINEEKRTLNVLYKWMTDPNPHVRRLCSEGTRPRLPWSAKISSFVTDPTPTIDILESLKNDEDLYVRRSVANHLGDIAKDHLELVLDICDRWLLDATFELKWVIRHALRHPAKIGNKRALEIRKSAK